MVDLAACDRNLAEAIRVNLAGSGRGFEDGIVVAGASGFDDAFFNAAVTLAPAPDPRATLEHVVAFFDRIPFSMWLREGFDPPLGDATLAAGLAVSNGPPLLVLEDPQVPDPPAGLEIAPFEEADRPAAITASALGNGMAPHLAGVFVPPGIADHPVSGIVLGRVGGEIVTTAQWVLSDDVVGIYAVSTVPEHRSRGLGAAITWAAVAEGLRRGATWSVLQASQMGLGVYERMGYEVVGRYQFLSRPSASVG